MRIHRIEIEDFMRLKIVDVSPKGHVTELHGENGSGKSAVLNAIMCALSGKSALPMQPVRDGQEIARITLDLGEIIVKWKCTKDRNVSVIVEAADGARYQKPMTMLEKLFGERSIDPVEFIQADPKKRLEMLRRLVTLDVDIDALDAANLREMELRKDWNRKVVSLKEHVETLAQGIDPEMDVTPEDEQALLTDLTEASEKNAAATDARRARDHEEVLINALVAEVSSQQRYIAQLRQSIELAEAKIALSNEALEAKRDALANADPMPEFVNVGELNTRFQDARKVNAIREQQQRQRQMHKAAVDELTAATLNAENLTESMQSRVEEKRAAIARAKMPVKGLSFDERGVLFNNIPFDQASSGQQVRVSTAIAMEAQPQLRVLLIRNGPLVDEEGKTIIAQMAEDRDYHVFMESSVSKNGKVGLLLEAGEVTAIDGVPVREEEEASATVGA